MGVDPFPRTLTLFRCDMFMLGGLDNIIVVYMGPTFSPPRYRCYCDESPRIGKHWDSGKVTGPKWRRQTAMKIPGLLLGSALLAVGVSQQTKPDAGSAVRDYRSWTLVTAQPVDMAPAIAMSCVGPGPITRDPKNPHTSAVFQVWVNQKGKSAMLAKTPKPFPVGSIIVKEKFERSSARFDEKTVPDLLTVMIKREKGFDPDNGDWQYATTKSARQQLNFERLGYCADCHRHQKTTDYVFRAYGSYLR